MNIKIDREVLAWVDDPRPALSLISHPANARVARESGGFHVLDEDTGRLRSLSGLTKPLAECFWPHFTGDGRGGGGGSGGTGHNRSKTKKQKKTLRVTLLESARPAEVAAQRPKSRAQAAAVRAATASNAQAAVTGFVRGSLIHRQVEDLFTLDVEAFHRRNPHGAHPWAVKLFGALIQREWKPLAIELVVFAEALGIATAIDQVWVDRRGTVHFIEVKTGYVGETAWRGVLPGKAGQMRAPFAALPCSALHRAVVQILLSTALAVYGAHGFDGPFECWVVHVTDEPDVHFEPLQRAFVDQFLPLAYAALLEHQTQQALKRAAVRKAMREQQKKNNAKAR